MADSRERAADGRLFCQVVCRTHKDRKLIFKPVNGDQIMRIADYFHDFSS